MQSLQLSPRGQLITSFLLATALAGTTSAQITPHVDDASLSGDVLSWTTPYDCLDLSFSAKQAQQIGLSQNALQPFQANSISDESSAHDDFLGSSISRPADQHGADRKAVGAPAFTYPFGQDLRVCGTLEMQVMAANFGSLAKRVGVGNASVIFDVNNASLTSPGISFSRFISKSVNTPSLCQVNGSGQISGGDLSYSLEGTPSEIKFEADILHTGSADISSSGGDPGTIGQWCSSATLKMQGGDALTASIPFNLNESSSFTVAQGDFCVLRKTRADPGVGITYFTYTIYEDLNQNAIVDPGEPIAPVINATNMVEMGNQGFNVSPVCMGPLSIGPVASGSYVLVCEVSTNTKTFACTMWCPTPLYKFTGQTTEKAEFTMQIVGAP